MNRFVLQSIARFRTETARYGRWFSVRWVVWAAAVLTTIFGATVFVHLMTADGNFGVLDLPLVILFIVLFGWISFGFWMATSGFVYCLAFGRRPHVSALDPTADKLPLTAVVMPIYNEDPHRVMAGLRSMYESLARASHADRFHWFIVSDTTNPRVAVREEMAWARLVEKLGRPTNVFYRRRPRNIGRKSGNLRDFCERWGRAYVYMIVLDADSLMIGPTLVQMVQRMEQSPDVGILQVPPTTVCRNTFFARLQQFSAASYGELFATGLALVTGLDGNYFGHNAVLRMRPFMNYCGLPRLPGKPPLGGEIFSHDFVEAAMIRRAGWRVVIAHDLDGSYEESPTTIVDYSKRDQRWCQGNLQHARLVLRSGLHPSSRMHMLIGIMSYVSSSLWLLMLVLGMATVAHWPSSPGGESGQSFVQMVEGVGLFAFTMALLLVPKFWGYVLVRNRPLRMLLQRGDDAVLLSLMLETLMSFLLAPIFMVYHVTFVFSALTGHMVQWSAQQRGERRSGWRDSARACRWHTIAGISLAVIAYALTPSLFWWLAPIWGPLMVSIPVTHALDSVKVGEWLARRGLLVIPEETAPPPLITRLLRYMQERNPAADAGGDPVRRVIVDPSWHARHMAILDGTHMPDPPIEDLRPTIDQLMRDPSHQPTDDQWRTLLLSRAAMRELHRGVWRHWPDEELREAMTPAVMH
ncbi:MAG: glucans biosynthesis glucosyltransferase MdoH [Planctomycetes bacterium]|nr:glucans biosynthesis glucosyltransferase MdoH [Planctomycetota bacterium]